MNTAESPSDYYLISHGKLGALGSFRTRSSLVLRRGDRVVVQSTVGLELGVVLGPASISQSRLLGDAGQIVRRLDSEERFHTPIQTDAVFAEARSLVRRLKLDVEVIDVELTLDGQTATLMVLAGASANADPLIEAIEASFGIDVKLHNLSVIPAEKDEEAHGSCGKSDCGSSEGGCSSCGSGGGCGTGCGTGSDGVDLRAYFSHLRTRMEADQRVSLL